jgi:hypothetical protein
MYIQIKNLVNCNHVSIIPVLQVQFKETFIVLVAETPPGISLQDCYIKHKVFLSEIKVKRIAKTVLNTLQAIHSRYYAHGTLALDCIYLDGFNIEEKDFTRIQINHLERVYIQKLKENEQDFLS